MHHRLKMEKGILPEKRGTYEQTNIAEEYKETDGREDDDPGTSAESNQ